MFCGMSRVLVPFVLSVALALPQNATAQNFSTKLPCGATVPDELSKLGIGQKDIRTSLTEADWEPGDDSDAFLGWFVWMELKSCTGRFVIRLSSLCVVQSLYTTGQCRIDGVRHSD